VPNPREVRDTFDQLIRDNDKAVRELEDSIRTIKRDREPVEKLYAGMIDRYAESLVWPSLDEDALNAIGKANGGKADFVKAYNTSMTESRQAEIRLNALTATHGELSVLETRMEQLQHQADKADGNAVKLARSAADKAEKLHAVDTFNAGAAKDAPKLEEGSIAYFNSKSGFAHVWSWLFNSHYRNGRAIIKEAEKGGVSIPDQQKQLKAAREELALAREKTDAIVAQKLEVEKPFREMKSVAEKVLTEEQIARGIKADVLKLLQNRDSFNATAKALGNKFPAHAVELRAKTEGFDKLEAGARKSIDGLKATTKKLRDPMDKLNKAVSRKPGMNINMDLGKTKKGVKAQQTLAKHKAAEIKKASDSIGKYETPSGSPAPVYLGPDPLDIYLGFMIADMLSHHHHHDVVTTAAGAATDAASSVAVTEAVQSVDPSVINDTLGIPDNIAADAGIDVGNLAPELSSAELSGLDGAFNDVSGIDVGNIDVGTFEVPDIPDISVPDIDVGGGLDLGGIDFGGFDF